MFKNYFLFLALFFLLTLQSNAQETINGSFEMLGQKSTFRNWMIIPGKSTYVIQADSNERHAGRYGVKLTDTSLVDKNGKNEAIIANTFGMTSSSKVYKIEIQAWVKFSNAKDSTIALFVQPLKGNEIIRSYVTSPQNEQKWQQIKLTYEVDKDKPLYGFYYGFEISANGKVWLDDLEIFVNGNKINDPEGFHFEPSAKNIKWLNSNLIPLSMTSLKDSHPDFKPIGKFLGDARIVALGEPTHGTHEAFKFKIQTIQYLVMEKGFRTIAMEEVIATCDIMNELINTSNTSIKDSLMSLPFYKLYKTAEMLELLEWMRSFNANHPDNKVKFIGMDMEDIQMKSSRKLLRDYGRQHNPIIYQQVMKIDQFVDTLLKVNNTKGKEGDVMRAANQLKISLKELDRLLQNEVKKQEQVLFNLTTYLRVCEQWLASRFYGADRDRLMAENIKFYSANFPAEKLVIWAHNFHVANQKTALLSTTAAYLKDFYQKDFISIGFTSSQGTYTAAHDYSQKNWNVFPFETAYRGTYEYILAKANSESYFLPLNNKSSQASAASWLKMQMKHFDNGFVKSGSDDDYKFFHGNMMSVFDGIMFVKETSGSQSYMIK